jgi:hypothetical protein
MIETKSVVLYTRFGLAIIMQHVFPFISIYRRFRLAGFGNGKPTILAFSQFVLMAASSRCFSSSHDSN